MTPCAMVLAMAINAPCFGASTSLLYAHGFVSANVDGGTYGQEAIVYRKTIRTRPRYLPLYALERQDRVHLYMVPCDPDCRSELRTKWKRRRGTKGSRTIFVRRAKGSPGISASICNGFAFFWSEDNPEIPKDAVELCMLATQFQSQTR